jgi:LAO/AO transport system kinase
VNKADRDGADTVVRDLRYMLSLGDRRTDLGWRVPILRTVASKGEGADEVVDAIEAHGAYLAESGRLEARRVRRAADEVEGIALTSLRVDLRSSGELDRLAALVVAGELDPYTAADELVRELS